MRGFTLIELLITVAVLGILASMGIPTYRDYIDTSRVNLVQNNLRSIYLQERDYLTDNGAYYSTGGACVQSLVAINTDLFSGTQVLSADDGYTYCITQATPTDFQARAEEIGGAGRIFTLDQTNTDNF